MNKYLILTILFAGAFALIGPEVAEALDLGSGMAKNAAVQAGFDGNTNDTSLAENIGAIIKMLLSFTGVIFLVLTVYAGFLWMNARGDESKIEKSQSILRSAIIGLIITVGAYSITNFVVPRIVAQTAAAPVEQPK